MELLKINDKSKEVAKKHHPDKVPFMIQGKDKKLYLVVKDFITEKYKCVDLSDGYVYSKEYDEIQELFEDNDKIVSAEINILGEWNGEE